MDDAVCPAGQVAGRCLIALMSPLECVWVCLCPLACVATFRLVTTHEEYRRTLDNIIHSHTGLHARARVSTKQKGKYIDGENTNSQPFIAPGERVGLRCILRAPQTYPFNPPSENQRAQTVAARCFTLQRPTHSSILAVCFHRMCEAPHSPAQAAHLPPAASSLRLQPHTAAVRVNPRGTDSD